MEQLIRSGIVVDVILVILALEVAVAGYVFWRRRQGIHLLSFIANSLAGASLVLALRAALLESGGLFVAIYLAAALLAHVADIALRLTTTKAAPGTPSADSP